MIHTGVYLVTPSIASIKMLKYIHSSFLYSGLLSFFLCFSLYSIRVYLSALKAAVNTV